MTKISWSYHLMTIINECFRSEKMKYYCVQNSHINNIIEVYFCFDLRTNVPIGGLTDKKTIITLLAKSFHINFCFVSAALKTVWWLTISLKERQQKKKKKIKKCRRLIHSIVQYWKENGIFILILYSYMNEFDCHRCNNNKKWEKSKDAWN